MRDPSKAPSLRRTSLVWMSVLLAIVGFVTIAISYFYAWQDAAEFLDGQLRQVALNAGPGLPGTRAPRSEDIDPEDRLAVTIWDAQGRLVRASMAQVTFPRRTEAGYSQARAGGEDWRVYTAIGPQGTVAVAQQETVRREIAASAAVGAAAPILIVIPLSWLVVGWAMNRMTRRLDELARDLSVRGSAATEPIRLDDVPIEVAPLVESMNGLIIRLQAALAAQKRFLADAAHELRSPLAAMQIQLDNVASGDEAARRGGLAALSRGVRRAGALVAQLLDLARLDEAPSAAFVPTDLSALLLDCVASVAPLAGHKSIDLGAQVQGPGELPFEVPVDPAEMRTLFGNLLDNALRYTPEGGKIDVNLRTSGAQVIAEIVDTGPGIPEGDEARIFERFHRAAPGHSEGSGLGLAIVRRIADRHGFSVTVENRTDGTRGALARVSMALDRPIELSQPGSFAPHSDLR